MKAKEYYNKVAGYFDRDSADFDRRYEQNPVLKRLRQCFRDTTERFPFCNALEIGCGTGIDLCYFGQKYKDRTFYGVDIAPEMVSYTNDKVQKYQLTNVFVETGSVEQVKDLFPNLQVDMVYVYFGALNTVYDLQYAARCLSELVNSGGKIILTVVNRWYLMDIPLYMMKGEFRRAFDRVTDQWQGYSSEKSLGSRCYTSKDMDRAFSPFFLLKAERGYCIVYPAWYRSGLLDRMGEWGSEQCWKVDNMVNRTPFWNSGEYSLYVYEKRYT